MQPSSLIFLVIIAIWAAYFIQHWVRRREHLATARSVDRFSESMRVLEVRSPVAAPDLSAPQPRSYAVSPARPARAEVLVKRAAQAPLATPAPEHESGAPAASGSARVPSGRRTRGITLLGSLATLLVTVGLASFGVVTWLAILAPVAAVGGVLVWMRRGAEAERAARRAAAPQRSVAPQRSARPQREQGSSQPVAERRPATREAAAASAPAAAGADADVDADDVTVPARESFYDIQAVERHGAAAVSPAAAVVATTTIAAPLVDEDDIPLTWDPVPVPRPTYTMKAMAHRTPAPPVGQGVPPELAEPAYEEPVRRVAGA